MTRTKEEILQEIDNRREARNHILKQVNHHQSCIDNLMDELAEICTRDEMFEVYKDMIRSAFDDIDADNKLELVFP